MIDFKERPLKATFKSGDKSASFFVNGLDRKLSKSADGTYWSAFLEICVVTDETDINKVKEFFDEWSSVDTVEVSLRKYNNGEWVYDPMMVIPGTFGFTQITNGINGHQSCDTDLVYVIVYKAE